MSEEFDKRDEPDMTLEKIETWRKVLIGELDPKHGRQTSLYCRRINTLCDLAAKALSTPQSAIERTERSGASALSGIGKPFEKWWPTYRASIHRRDEYGVARDAWLAGYEYRGTPQSAIREGQWIAVSERKPVLPSDSTHAARVLAWVVKDGMAWPAIRFYRRPEWASTHPEWWCDGNAVDGETITHWMPLPNAPADSKTRPT